MRKTIAIIAMLLSVTVAFAQANNRTTSVGTKYVEMPVHYSAMKNLYPVFPADTVKYHVYQDSTVLNDVIGSSNYSKFEWGETDTPTINRLYSYAFFNRVPENSRLNAGASRGKYVVDQTNLFNGEFSIELDPKTSQFMRVNISGDSTKVMEAIGRCAFLGSEVEMTARLYPGKKKIVYVGRKKYLITVKQIK